MQGKPHWLTYQSRLLGPSIVSFFTLFTGNPGTAYLFFTLVTFLSSNLPVLSAAHLTFGDLLAYFALLIFALLTCFFADDFWFYPWDLTSIIILSSVVLLAVRLIGFSSWCI